MAEKPQGKPWVGRPEKPIHRHGQPMTPGKNSPPKTKTGHTKEK